MLARIDLALRKAWDKSTILNMLYVRNDQLSQRTLVRRDLYLTHQVKVKLRQQKNTADYLNGASIRSAKHVAV